MSCTGSKGTVSYSLHRTAHQEREEIHKEMCGNLHEKKRGNHNGNNDRIMVVNMSNWGRQWTNSQRWYNENIGAKLCPGQAASLEKALLCIKIILWIFMDRILDLHCSASASVLYLLMVSGVQKCNSYRTIMENPGGYAERQSGVPGGWTSWLRAMHLISGWWVESLLVFPWIWASFPYEAEPFYKGWNWGLRRLSNHPRSHSPYGVSL